MKIIIIAAFQLFAGMALCQTINYTSTVIDNEKQPVAFATVQELGSENYTTTDKNGEFSLETNSNNFTLRISSIGFESTEIKITSGVFPEEIIVQRSSESLDEVVVTALGIKKEKQALVSAVSKVNAEQLINVPQTNLINSLAGQVPGVQITNGSSGVGSSSRIVIRGENSLSGSNQPLFVVDGVPISNEQITSDLVNNGALQEVDFGNGGSEISPDDIASISILKGAGSAALYGARAANGVVLISTKRGDREKGFGVSINSNFTVETLLTLPEYQNKYGLGSNGEYAFQNGVGGGVNDGGISSYGPQLDAGFMIPQFDSPSVDINGNPVRGGDIIARTLPDGSLTEITPTPWISRPDNVRDFFKTGITYQNNISINNSGESGSARLSYSNLRNEGILPNTDLKRDGIAVSLDQNLSEKLRVTTFVNYINTRSGNRPNLGYGYENVLYGFNWTGRQTNIAALKDYWQAGQTGRQHFDINYLWLTNPYLTLFENTNSFEKNRVLGNVSVTYDLSENLSFKVRTGMDMYNDDREFRRSVSTNANPFGSYREDNIRFTEMNTDFLVTYKNEINKRLDYTLTIGANRFDQKIHYAFAEASQLALPEIYTLANSRAPLKGSSENFNKRINSVYGTANLGFENELYIDLTYRNDWSSTLPKKNNSFGYYSAGFSYVASNGFNLPEDISFLKFRLSAASVGNDTDPFQSRQIFQFNGNYGSNFRVTNENVLKNINLKPERLNAYEGGLEAWFLKGRIQFEASVYQNLSKDQIISRPISNASGFGRFNENGGKVRTRGLELMLSASPIKTSALTWNTSVNFSTFRSVVTELPEGVDQFVTATANIFNGGSNTVLYIARENGRVGDMYGTGFVQVDGQDLYDTNGLPVQDGDLRLLGNYNPDFSMGFSNSFSYKNFDLNFLFDWRQGGTIVSRIKALGSTSGVLKETLLGREGGGPNTQFVDGNGIIGDGVVNIGTDENPQYTQNTTPVPASTFNNAYYDRGNEASALYDASYIKLRQVSIYYTFSKKTAKYIGVENLKLGLIGSNLLLFTENPHFDPELNAFQERNIVYGVDDFSYPSTRSFGVSLKTNF
ncbi:SusC/RagA family TonB-linked outer membrane protein [Salegentibacter sp. JZCK2]|uniref:SusC/RagA family TonB-linked outer membrane protein n=1 Tax=Salegentibacter tibetensis TaxID=2873600 RepID=UPI001CCE06F8|nr:SusC/RagA family TonB-linked outer membrane protein [Salegentibacter tibetensis]MBZ9730872.1 SusC/RagA family TonB-linked outer membrane protein [Salegentibacter tibetensis]